MNPVTEVAERPANEVAEYDAAIAAIQAQQNDELEGVTYSTPILKLAQGLTAEVSAGDAEAGDFINTLTGEALGNKVEFIVSAFQKGRSASVKDGKHKGRYFVCVAEKNIPESWADLVGEEFVGTPFSEYPDAEEQFKASVNAKEREWGGGPLISTTYVFTGHVLTPRPEGSDEPEERQPVRLSLLRSTKPSADKILTLKRGVFGNKPFWEKVFELESKPKEFGRNTSYVLNVKLGRDTTVEEKRDAAELAQAVFGGLTVDNADEAEKGSARVAPSSNGGLEV